VVLQQYFKKKSQVYASAARASEETHDDWATYKFWSVSCLQFNSPALWSLAMLMGIMVAFIHLRAHAGIAYN
jgi:hypothetical protein